MHERTREKFNNHQQTRDANIRHIFNLINGKGMITRAELVRVTGLSASTISSLVDELVRDELVVNLGLARKQTGAGRRPIMLKVNPSGRQIPVFSLSRWGVSYTLFDMAYNVLEQSFRPHLSDKYGGCEPNISENACDSSKDYADIIFDILNNQSEKFNARRAVGVLISYPGVYLEQENTYLLTAMQISIRKQVIDELGERLNLSIFMGNSSMSMAYAEKKSLDASGTPVSDLIYVNVCDGVGAGIIADGEMFTRPGRISGEIGHITVDIGGRQCFCGNRGCLERYVNINAIIEAVRAAVASDVSGLHSEEIRDLLEDTTLEKIGRAYDNSVEPVVSSLNSIAEKLFAGIYSTVSVTGIKCVVVGGIERLNDGFFNKLRSFTNGKNDKVLTRGVRIMYPHTGAYADVIGIAQYYIDKLFTIKD